MSYARETLVLHSVTPDLIEEDAPLEAWSRGENVVFRNTETIAAPADLPVFPHVTQKPRTMVYVEPNDNGYWLYANETGVWATDGATEYEVTPNNWNASADAVWSSCVINGLAVINASNADPIYWDGAPFNQCQKLPNWPDGGRCLAMRSFSNSLWAVGFISESGARVRWSDAAPAGTIPQHWTPAADNLAGFVDLSPYYTNCVDAAVLRDELVIYKRKGVYAASLIGGTAVFSFRKVFAEYGCAATNAVTAGPSDVHMFLGNDGDVYLNDGVQVQSILDGRAERLFYDGWDNKRDAVYSALTLHREKLGILIYTTNLSAEGNRALFYDYVSGDIGFRDMPDPVRCGASGRMLNDVQDNSWDASTRSWDQADGAWNATINSQTVEDILIGCNSTPIYQFGAAETALPTSLEKAGLAFGTPQRGKIINRVWPKVRGRSGDVLTFQLGTQEYNGGPVSMSPEVPFTIGQTKPVDTFASGRFLSLFVRSDDDVASWRLGSIDVEYREAGKW